MKILNLAKTRVTELPKNILKLRKLRQLLAFNRVGYTKDCMVGGIKAPYKIGWLQSLLCLYIINADFDNTVVREIGKLTELRMLRSQIWEEKTEESFVLLQKKLKNLIGLEVASILWDDVLDLDHIPSSSSLQFLWRLFLRGQLEKLPQWIHSLRGLTRVILCSSEMEDDLLECFEQLPNLLGFT